MKEMRNLKRDTAHSHDQCEVNGALFVVPGRAGSNFSFMGQECKALGDSIKTNKVTKFDHHFPGAGASVS